MSTKSVIEDRLFELEDKEYGNFSAKLMPTVKRDKIIGVRTPEIRMLAKDFSKSPEAELFLTQLPHRYYEENNVHGFIIEQMKDYDACITALDKFLPYIDNWATCDLISPKIFKKHLPELLIKIKGWIASDKTYTIRFGTEMLMSFYLDKEFKPEYLELAASIRSSEYYVNMMTAWFFATALAKQYDATLPFIEKQRLDKWTHNKAIQKAIESYRITDEQKTYLRSLKIK